MRALLAVFLSLFITAQSIAATLEDDTNRYVVIFSGDRALHSDAADTFSYMGLSDPRIFDLIEKLILAEAQPMRDDREGKNRVARYIRSLGFSGQSKYIPTIERFVTDKVYERYAKTALVDLPNYHRWNAVISNRATFTPTLSDDANRVMNMLKSDDLMLKRVGAKRVYFANHDDVLLEQLAKDLKANAPTVATDGETADCIAWLAKGLGSAKLERYRPLLQEVSNTAGTNKVRDHAKLTLEKYNR